MGLVAAFPVVSAAPSRSPITPENRSWWSTPRPCVDTRRNMPVCRRSLRGSTTARNQPVVQADRNAANSYWVILASADAHSALETSWGGLSARSARRLGEPLRELRILNALVRRGAAARARGCPGIGSPRRRDRARVGGGLQRSKDATWYAFAQRVE
jgi:hypothetical protein